MGSTQSNPQQGYFMGKKIPLLGFLFILFLFSVSVVKACSYVDEQGMSVVDISLSENSDKLILNIKEEHNSREKAVPIHKLIYNISNQEIYLFDPSLKAVNFELSFLRLDNHYYAERQNNSIRFIIFDTENWNDSSKLLPTKFNQSITFDQEIKSSRYFDSWYLWDNTNEVIHFIISHNIYLGEFASATAEYTIITFDANILEVKKISVKPDLPMNLQQIQNGIDSIKFNEDYQLLKLPGLSSCAITYLYHLTFGEFVEITNKGYVIDTRSDIVYSVSIDFASTKGVRLYDLNTGKLVEFSLSEDQILTIINPNSDTGLLILNFIPWVILVEIFYCWVKRK